MATSFGVNLIQLEPTYRTALLCLTASLYMGVSDNALQLSGRVARQHVKHKGLLSSRKSIIGYTLSGSLVTSMFK